MIPPDIPIPLNQGVLDPVEIIVPEGCFLNPRGVVAISGSTISSQRLVDVILRAFNAAAASQGCASSLGFGIGGKDPVTGEVRPGFSYGEAIGGGSGAGPTWHGVSGVAVVSPPPPPSHPPRSVARADTGSLVSPPRSTRPTRG